MFILTEIPNIYVLKHMIENKEVTGRKKASGIKRLLASTKAKMILLIIHFSHFTRQFFPPSLEIMIPKYMKNEKDLFP